MTREELALLRKPQTFWLYNESRPRPSHVIRLFLKLGGLKKAEEARRNSIVLLRNDRNGTFVTIRQISSMA